MHAWRVVLSLVLLFSMAAALTGDKIRLKAGGRLEGIVREERCDALIIETPAGLVTVLLQGHRVDRLFGSRGIPELTGNC